jgi:hypothetical protein
MTGKNPLMFFGPKDDGTYVVEFKTSRGEVPRDLIMSLRLMYDGWHGFGCAQAPYEYTRLLLRARPWLMRSLLQSA